MATHQVALTHIRVRHIEDLLHEHHQHTTQAAWVYWRDNFDALYVAPTSLLMMAPPLIENQIAPAVAATWRTIEQLRYFRYFLHYWRTRSNIIREETAEDCRMWDSTWHYMWHLEREELLFFASYRSQSYGTRWLESHETLTPRVMMPALSFIDPHGDNFTWNREGEDVQLQRLSKDVYAYFPPYSWG